MLQFFYLASYLWTGCFAYHLNQFIVADREQSELSKNEKYFHVVSWGIPGAICLSLYLRQLSGSNVMGIVDRPWCWITTVSDDRALARTLSSPQDLLSSLPIFQSRSFLLLTSFVPRLFSINKTICHCCYPNSMVKAGSGLTRAWWSKKYSFTCHWPSYSYITSSVRQPLNIIFHVNTYTSLKLSHQT